MSIIKYIAILISLFITSVCFGQTKSESVIINKEHSPRKATILSAVLPGAGQFYNKKYWKIPVVYAGIGVLTYIVVDNQNKFNNYKDAYLLRKDGGTDKYYNVYNENALISLMDRHRRNRDIFAFGTLLIYILQIVDANVDANLYDFDVGDDLSLRICPNFYNQNNTNVPTLGISCQLKF